MSARSYASSPVTAVWPVAFQSPTVVVSSTFRNTPVRSAGSTPARRLDAGIVTRCRFPSSPPATV